MLVQKIKIDYQFANCNDIPSEISRHVVLETALSVSRALETNLCVLGLGLERQGLGLDTYGLGLGLGLEGPVSKSVLRSSNLRPSGENL